MVYEGVLYGGVTVDLSASGCSLALNSDLPLTKESSIKLIMTTDEIDVEGFCVDVVVAWVNGCVMGCELKFEDDSTRKMYYKFLKTINEK